MESYYLNRLRRAFKGRHDAGINGILNRDDARMYLKAARAERDGSAARYRHACAMRAASIFGCRHA